MSRQPTSDLKYTREPVPGVEHDMEDVNEGIIEEPEPSDLNRLPVTMDLSLLLEKYHFGEFSRGRSVPSKSMFSVSIPDPRDGEAEFVYNYFLPDERVSINTDAQQFRFDSRTVNVNDIGYLAAQEQKARFVRITFKKPQLELSQFLDPQNMPNIDGQLETDDLIFGSFSDIEEQINLSFEEIIARLVVEGATSNANYTGFEMIDTFADAKIYENLDSLMTFIVPENQASSPRERAQSFVTSITQPGSGIVNPTGASKSILIDILSDLQPQGVSMAPGDVDEAEFSMTTDALTKQSFGVKLNNLVINDIIQNASFNANTIYEDEVRAIATLTPEIQDSLVDSIDPDMIYEHDYQMKVTPLKTEDINITDEQILQLRLIQSSLTDLSLTQIMHGDAALSQADFENFVASLATAGFDTESARAAIAAITNILNPIEYILREAKVPEIKISGYLIQKTEILSNGNTKTFPNIFIDNPKHFSEYIDEDVRYGAAYSYKVRTVALVRSVIKVYNRSGGSRYKVATFMVASEGSTLAVRCVENIPPPPPIRIRPRLNSKYRCIEILWDFPFNKQRDIKRFQVFKRATTNDPFTLMKEYNFDDSVIQTVPLETAPADKVDRVSSGNIARVYIDTDFKISRSEVDSTFSSSSAIYAIAAVDAHGMSSNYSSQIRVSYDRLTNRVISDCISQKPAPKPYPNLYINSDFFEDLITSSGRSRCTVFFDPEYGEVYKSDPTRTLSIEQNYIKKSDTDYNYTFQFINVDLQQEKRIPVRIVDKSGRTINIPLANISPTNLSFEFGV